MHKRLWQLTRDRTSLDGAVRALERGFYIRNDYYNGINLAYMLNERALEQTDLAEATADFILARRVRREVRDIAEAWLKDARKARQRFTARQNLLGRSPRSPKRP